MKNILSIFEIFPKKKILKKCIILKKANEKSEQCNGKGILECCEAYFT